MGSTALPGRALLPILGRPLLWHVDRARPAGGADRGVVVVTTDTPARQPIRSLLPPAGDRGASPAASATPPTVSTARRSTTARTRSSASTPRPRSSTRRWWIACWRSTGTGSSTTRASHRRGLALPRGRPLPRGDGRAGHGPARARADVGRGDGQGRSRAPSRPTWSAPSAASASGRSAAEQNLAHLRLTIENEGDLELARQVYGVPEHLAERLHARPDALHSWTAGPSSSASPAASQAPRPSSSSPRSRNKTPKGASTSPKPRKPGGRYMGQWDWQPYPTRCGPWI